MSSNAVLLPLHPQPCVCWQLENRCLLSPRYCWTDFSRIIYKDFAGPETRRENRGISNNREIVCGGGHLATIRLRLGKLAPNHSHPCMHMVIGNDISIPCHHQGRTFFPINSTGPFRGRNFYIEKVSGTTSFVAHPWNTMGAYIVSLSLELPGHSKFITVDIEIGKQQGHKSIGLKLYQTNRQHKMLLLTAHFGKHTLNFIKIIWSHHPSITARNKARRAQQVIERRVDVAVEPKIDEGMQLILEQYLHPQLGANLPDFQSQKDLSSDSLTDRAVLLSGAGISPQCLPSLPFVAPFPLINRLHQPLVLDGR